MAPRDIITIMQGAALAGDNIKFSKKKNKDVGDFMGQGVKNIVGASLIGETANVLHSF